VEHGSPSARPDSGEVPHEQRDLPTLPRGAHGRSLNVRGKGLVASLVALLLVPQIDAALATWCDKVRFLLGPRALLGADRGSQD
jgi:hypothetical protein